MSLIFLDHYTKSRHLCDYLTHLIIVWPLDKNFSFYASGGIQYFLYFIKNLLIKIIFIAQNNPNFTL